jgi:2-polyprenyl-6-methoxyphenol hydroxylase-like FAD-dependent oxidoreductase
MASLGAYDVFIVGAGLAGTVAARVFSRLGLRVALADPHLEHLPEFKTEKLEPDQVLLLRELDLLDEVRANSVRIWSVTNARGDGVLATNPIEQYGIRYPALVKVFRASVPREAMLARRVAGIELSGDRQTVCLAGGDSASARLVVLASGASAEVARAATLLRRMVSRKHSLTIGFDVARQDGRPWTFDSLTYYSNDPSQRFGFLVVFPVAGTPKEVLRINFFTYRDPKEPWARAFVDDPVRALEDSIPGLHSTIGKLAVVSKLDLRAVDLFVTDSPIRPGLVAIADAFQTNCPATGTGVSKALTDIVVLSEQLRAWMSTPGMGADKIEQFYRSERKVACDRSTLDRSLYQRRFSIEDTIRWRLQREAAFARLRLRGMARSALPLSLLKS